jgi:hypothetical protein
MTEVSICPLCRPPPQQGPTPNERQRSETTQNGTEPMSESLSDANDIPDQSINQSLTVCSTETLNSFKKIE